MKTVEHATRALNGTSIVKVEDGVNMVKLLIRRQRSYDVELTKPPPSAGKAELGLTLGMPADDAGKGLYVVAIKPHGAAGASGRICVGCRIEAVEGQPAGSMIKTVYEARAKLRDMLTDREERLSIRLTVTHDDQYVDESSLAAMKNVDV